MTAIATDSLGILETTGFTPALVALDAMEKCASLRLLQVELNDFYGVVIKVLGSVADVEAAIATGRSIAQQMGGQPIAQVMSRPATAAWPALESRSEFNPLIQQDVVMSPQTAPTAGGKKQKDSTVSDTPNFALGLIETQGFTAVFEAIDSACKAANVEVVCKEKLGGGYVTVVVRGDVAAVKAAVEAGQAKVEGLGKLIAAHVIARPSAGVLSLLPKS